MKQKKSYRKRTTKFPKHLQQLNHYAAWIDVGSRSHFVAVPEGADDQPVREFSTFTDDLECLAQRLISCNVTTVAMESTGIYWIPVFEILEFYGLDVRLANARHVKNVPGRKSDVLDCQWLQQLHTYGLLRGAFRPIDQVCTPSLCSTTRNAGAQCIIVYSAHAKSPVTDESPIAQCCHRHHRGHWHEHY